MAGRPQWCRTGAHRAPRRSEERHRALKEAAARRNKSIAALIEESLEHYGIKTTETAAALVARSHRAAGLNEDDALEIAVEETRRARD